MCDTTSAHVQPPSGCARCRSASEIRPSSVSSSRSASIAGAVASTRTPSDIVPPPVASAPLGSPLFDVHDDRRPAPRPHRLLLPLAVDVHRVDPLVVEAEQVFDLRALGDRELVG